MATTYPSCLHLNSMTTTVKSKAPLPTLGLWAVSTHLYPGAPDSRHWCLSVDVGIVEEEASGVSITTTFLGSRSPCHLVLTLNLPCHCLSSIYTWTLCVYSVSYGHYQKKCMYACNSCRQFKGSCALSESLQSQQCSLGPSCIRNHMRCFFHAGSGVPLQIPRIKASGGTGPGNCIY